MDPEILHIPFFPLNIFLLPGEQLPLHIFESRYRQLFKEAEDNGIEFGLPYEDKELKQGFVSVCRLIRVVKRYESGESDVIVEGRSIAELKDYEAIYEGKLYPGGYVSTWENPILQERPSEELIEVFRKYIELKYGTRPQPSNIRNYRIVDLAASIAVSNQDKIKLIMMDTAEKQSRFLKGSIAYLNLLLAQEKSMENGFILN